MKNIFCEETNTEEMRKWTKNEKIRVQSMWEYHLHLKTTLETVNDRKSNSSLFFIVYTNTHTQLFNFN